VIETALHRGIPPRAEIMAPEDTRYYRDLGVRHFNLLVSTLAASLPFHRFLPLSIFPVSRFMGMRRSSSDLLSRMLQAPDVEGCAFLRRHGKLTRRMPDRLIATPTANPVVPSLDPGHLPHGTQPCWPI
jgi:hypothetical protein